MVTCILWETKASSTCLPKSKPSDGRGPRSRWVSEFSRRWSRYFFWCGDMTPSYKHHFEGEIPRFIVEKAALVEPGKNLIAENEKIKLIETWNQPGRRLVSFFCIFRCWSFSRASVARSTMTAKILRGWEVEDLHDNDIMMARIICGPKLKE